MANNNSNVEQTTAKEATVESKNVKKEESSKKGFTTKVKDFYGEHRTACNVGGISLTATISGVIGFFIGKSVGSKNSNKETKKDSKK